jgi:hypothetical protein
MRRNTKKTLHGFGALAILAGSLHVSGMIAGADSPLPNTCTAAGRVDVAPIVDDDGVETGTAWELSGGGSCQGDQSGTYMLAFEGEGTSSSLGICSAGSATVADLELVVELSLTNAATGAERIENQRWRSPQTTFPVTTPFLIRPVASNGDDIGAGTLFTRIFGNCPDGGTPVATFDFVFDD